ncbi:long-chain-fatty-acid--CoA ligase [Lutimaribacter marinistellae]|uniref:Long-chain-fatty-acid--CoA ligase n=1 Tax=Lutimaribacter marinistellae TaxID=1820329 RepID=A0ABV7TDX7_9RHOB
MNMQNRHHDIWPPGRPFSLDPSPHSVFHNLLAAARRHPDHTAIWYYGRTLSYAQLLDEVRSLAGYLHHRAGVRPDDRVAIYMQNAPQFIIAYYAIMAANAVIVPVNPMCRGAELAHILRDSGARAIVFGAELAPEIPADLDPAACIAVRYADYIPETPEIEPPAQILATPDAPRATPWLAAIAAGLTPPEHTRGPQDWCIIPYSSGTTGMPKGCLHTHASVNATIFAYPEWVGMEEGARVLATLPFCHVTGMQNSMNMPILAGATIHILTRWNAEAAARVIEAKRIGHWRSITTMMIDFLSLPEIETYDLSSLQGVGGGGAQMPEAVARKMARLIGLDYLEAYGLTETMAPSHMNPPQAPRPQCLGIPIFDVDSRIIDPETLEELGPNQPGEIIIHGPQVFQGYWQRPEETDAVFLDIDGKRFLRSGDIGYVDEQGYFYFTDRLKRMVNVSGLKVWPAEVEAILHGHPDIAEACIVADPDPRTGEAVRAVIVPAGSQTDLPVEPLTEWCRANMAAYKVPKRFEFRDALPRSGTGKVLWRTL